MQIASLKASGWGYGFVQSPVHLPACELTVHLHTFWSRSTASDRCGSFLRRHLFWCLFTAKCCSKNKISAFVWKEIMTRDTLTEHKADGKSGGRAVQLAGSINQSGRVLDSV